MRALGMLTCVGIGVGAGIVAAGCSFTGPGVASDAAGGEMEVPSDGPMPDAQLCFGRGFGMVCLMEPPAEPRMLSGMIDTGVDTSCDHIMLVTGISSCVVVGTTVDVGGGGGAGGVYRAIGSRPLVIVASNILTVAGELDAGSQRGGDAGPGASSTLCPGVGAAENDDGGGGGGAGGSYFGPGGDGGAGDTNNNGFPPGAGAGGKPADQVVPSLLRAGCRGGNGGNGGFGSSPGSGGRGGGAVYLIAGKEIRISGRVSAYGAGGSAGNVQAGGGGGGSGGMIGLDAPAVNVSGFLTANGGGGGEGAGFSGGDGGDNGRTDAVQAAGGNGTSVDGGDGGNGSAGAVLGGSDGVSAFGGGGGGGGGAGFVYVKGTLALMGVASPAPSQN